MLHFALADGRIWLNDRRVVLMQSSVLGRIRQELIDAFGMETARAMFMRIGYMQGAQDAELVQRRWPKEDLTHFLAAGPRIHTLEGFVKVTTERVEFDRERGTYYGVFYWDDSSEAAQHLASHGVSTGPVCWLQAGCPTGYTSRLFGKPVIFREVSCAGMGADRCVVVGRHAEAWGEGVFERELFELPWKTQRPPPARRIAQVGLPAQPPAPPSNDVAVGASSSFERTRHLLRKVAATDATVLFVGESGVGKELFASQLHQLSARARGPFIAINCAAIPENLVESELFGVEKGAFTGAVSARAGYFERASQGTLFLDEVSSLAYAAQGKLLRALQERKVERVGGGRTIPVDVRVVSASNVDLAKEVAQGRFRQDLYFRLCVFPINIPPLRERRDDIPLLMAHFLRLYTERYGRRIQGFSRRATDALLQYGYPGNIRELQNLVERGVVYADDGGEIDIVHLFSGAELLPPFTVRLTPDGRLDQTPLDDADAPAPAADRSLVEDADRSFVDMERAIYRAALERNAGNVSAAARDLKLTRASLDYRLDKLGIKTRVAPDKHNGSPSGRPKRVKHG